MTLTNSTTYGAVELIDTLWNVNNIRLQVSVLRFPELIDTLWNVNITPPSK